MILIWKSKIKNMGWYNSTITGSEYAIQAYVDGALQTVNVGTSGSLFVNRSNNGDNRWGNLRSDFGDGVINNQGGNVHTIVANLDGNTVTPVDKAYLYSQNLRMLDMKDNEIPNQNNWAKSVGTPYETVYGNTTLAPTLDNAAYNTPGDSGVTNLPSSAEYEVRGLSNTVYYVVYNAHGTDPMTTGQNVVVRTYTGYGSVPAISKDDIEDVYAVGARAGGVNTSGNFTYYTAQVVVIELKTSYNKSASEQVFIPDFSEVGNSVGIEYVTMIRGNGNKEQVKVDLGNSNYFNGYDPANSANNGIRRPGLYFMDPSDTNADVYVLERMTPADIRDNDYLVGYVSESSDIMSNNYPQVEKMVRPDGFGNGWWNDFGNGSTTGTYATVGGVGYTGLQISKMTYPTAPTVADVKYYGRAVRDTTKTYTYGGTTASLVEAPAYNVLAQTRHNVDTTNEAVNGLNERWNRDDAVNGWYQFPNHNRNEVLVRYDGNTIVWAVSFDETSNLNAQRVWWNCLPVDEVDASVTAVPSFYGVTDNDQAGLDKAPATNSIKVNYRDVKNSTAGFNAGLNSDGTPATIHWVGAAAPSTPDRTGGTYTAVVTKNGTQTTWNLEVVAGTNDTKLYYNGIEATQTHGRYVYNGGSTTMAGIKAAYGANTAAGSEVISWTFKDGNSKVVKDEDNTVCTNPNWTVDITIQAEDGTEVTYTVFLDGKALITANMLSGYLTKNENNQVVYDVYWNPVNTKFYLIVDADGNGTGTTYDTIDAVLSAKLNSVFEEIGAAVNSAGTSAIVGDKLTNLGHVKGGHGQYGVMQFQGVEIVNNEDAGNLVTLNETIFIKVNCADPKSAAAAQTFTNKVEYTVYAVENADGSFGGYTTATTGAEITSSNLWASDNVAYALSGQVNTTIQAAGITDRFVKTASFEYGAPDGTADWQGDQTRHFPASVETPAKSWTGNQPNEGKWQMMVEILSTDNATAHTRTVGSVTFTIAGTITKTA